MTPAGGYHDVVDHMKPTLLKSVIVAAAVLGMRGTLHAQHPSSAACYRFDRPYFTAVGRPPGGGAVFTDSSSVVSLDSAAHASRPSGYPPADARAVHVPAMRVDSISTRMWLEMSFWRPFASDSIELSWRNGLYGPIFRLMVRSDSLVGRVRFTTDVVGREPLAQPASAVRVPCS